jgi:hypothetical protein
VVREVLKGDKPMDNKQFYEILPDGRYRFRVDHHLINDFNTCDRYFNYRHIPDNTDGCVWGLKSLNIKIALGSWWSSTMESFYHEMTFGTLPSEHHIYKFASDAWTEHHMEDYKNSDDKTREVFDKFGGIDGARLMALEYYEAFAKQHYTSWQIIGTELGFGWKDELPLGEDDKVVVYYGGKPDLVVLDRSQNMIMPLDFKTKDSVPGNATLLYKPHPQTTGYIFAVSKMIDLIQGKYPHEEQRLIKRPTKCIVMVCARFRPTEKPRSGVRQPRFLPVYPQYTADEIEEWRQSVIEKCRRLRDAIERGVWTPRESACHLYYNGCAFRRVCSQPANIRAALLKSDFVRVEPWSPYSTGEED